MKLPATPKPAAGSAPTDFLRLGVIFHQGARRGAGVSVINALGALEDWGWSSSAWFARPGELVADFKRYGGHAAVGDSPVHYSMRAWKRDHGRLRMATEWRRYSKQLRAHLTATMPHVIHANTLLALPEAFVARRLGFPIALYVQELPPRSAKTRSALRFAAHVAHAVMAASDAVADLLSGYFGEERVHVVHSGLPTCTSPVADSATGVFGSASTICHRKGVDVLLDAVVRALRDSPGLRFEHVGGVARGEEDFAKMLWERLAGVPKHISDRITFLGEVSDVPQHLRRWDFFALGSRQDPFPLAVLEAMAAGLPVVATRVGGIPEQITDGKEGVLVSAEDAHVLSEAILRLGGRPDLRRQMAMAARNTVAARFTLMAQAEAMHVAYVDAFRRWLRVGAAGL